MKFVMYKLYINELLNSIALGITAGVTMFGLEGYKIRGEAADLIIKDWQAVGGDITAATKKFEEIKDEG